VPLIDLDPDVHVLVYLLRVDPPHQRGHGEVEPCQSYFTGINQSYAGPISEFLAVQFKIVLRSFSLDEPERLREAYPAQASTDSAYVQSYLRHVQILKIT
jgi:hypothetical protein